MHFAKIMVGAFLQLLDESQPSIMDCLCFYLPIVLISSFICNSFDFWKNCSRKAYFNSFHVRMESSGILFNKLVASLVKDWKNLNLSYWLTPGISCDLQISKEFIKYGFSSTRAVPLYIAFRFNKWIIVLVIVNLTPGGSVCNTIAPDVIAPAKSEPSSSYIMWPGGGDLPLGSRGWRCRGISPSTRLLSCTTLDWCIPAGCWESDLGWLIPAIYWTLQTTSILASKPSIWP